MFAIFLDIKNSIFNDHLSLYLGINVFGKKNSMGRPPFEAIRVK